MFPETELVPDASAGTAVAAEVVLAGLVLVACTLTLLFKFRLALLVLLSLTELLPLAELLAEAGLLADARLLAEAGLLAAAGLFADARLLGLAERPAEAEVPAVAELLVAAGLFVDGAVLAAAAAADSPELSDETELAEDAGPDELEAMSGADEDDDTEAELEALVDRLGVEERLPGLVTIDAKPGELVDADSGADVLEADKLEVVGVVVLELETGAALSVGPGEVLVEDERGVVELKRAGDEELVDVVVERVLEDDVLLEGALGTAEELEDEVVVESVLERVDEVKVEN